MCIRERERQGRQSAAGLRLHMSRFEQKESVLTDVQKGGVKPMERQLSLNDIHEVCFGVGLTLNIVGKSAFFQHFGRIDLNRTVCC